MDEKITAEEQSVKAGKTPADPAGQAEAEKPGPAADSETAPENAEPDDSATDAAPTAGAIPTAETIPTADATPAAETTPTTDAISTAEAAAPADDAEIADGESLAIADDTEPASETGLASETDGTPGESGAEVSAAADEGDQPTDLDEGTDSGDQERGEDDEAAERVTVELEVGAAAFAHAPTGNAERDVDDVAIDLDRDPSEEEDEEPAPEGIDRRPDVLSWALTPVLVLVLGPLLTAAVAILVGETETGYPALCRAAAADNRCEETVLRMVAQHAVAFLIGWLLVWALPWWRGLRPYRIAFGVLLILVLVAAPLRLMNTLDYAAVLGLR